MSVAGRVVAAIVLGVLCAVVTAQVLDVAVAMCMGAKHYAPPSDDRPLRFGYAVRVSCTYTPDPDHDLNSEVATERVASGFPLPALCRESRYRMTPGLRIARLPATLLDSGLVIHGTKKHSVTQRISVPLRPIPIGLAANSLFYAGFILLLSSGLRSLRRRLRRRRGLCSACAYPTPLGDRCPECGTPIGNRPGITFE